MELNPKNNLLASAAYFQKICAEYRQKWEESGRDPLVIAEFIKAHYHAVNVPWVTDELRRLLTFETNRIQDIFKRGRGEGSAQNRLKTQAQDLMIYDRVNDKVAEGMSKSQAFDAVSETMIIDEYLTPGRIKNRYYSATKIRPEVYLFEDSNSITLALAPVRVTGSMPGSDKAGCGYGKVTIATTPKNPTP